ncbi:hypothetical protein [Nostoc sp. 'Peltigera malacea cyanobiont' DB3992]|uniref:hypothetical protein n=1 Tax=Nostoc sp. 'Peltigera malacea cyanobiont' DB3992 TaxID=1206980 RepID=UPI001180D909|nr:hypothetical protein [Nostoc sp. 'Peltigera malacea cyanobiont' DB3992]
MGGSASRTRGRAAFELHFQPEARNEIFDIPCPYTLRYNLIPHLNRKRYNKIPDFLEKVGNLSQANWQKVLI